MSSLKEQIEEKVKQALKGREEIPLSILRMLRSAIKYKEIELKKALDDVGVIAVVDKMVKQAKESIEQFQKGNRADLTEKTQKELFILEQFLPKRLDLKELELRIREIIKKVGATSPKEMGQVMKSVTENLAGRIDMKEASRIVREILSK